MTLKLLLAEDAPDVAQAVTFGIRMAWPGSQVTVATDGAEALRLFAEALPDIVVLDIALPVLDGFAVCQRLREVSQVPILMLTVRDGTLDKVRALELGADDYVTKPFDPLELVARLRALVRRATGAAGPAEPPLHVADITVDLETHEVRVKGAVVPLTATEYRLLEVFLRHPGTVLPHQYLLEHAWGPEYRQDAHSLRVFVRRLRRKLGDDAEHPRYIQTEWGVGYRFVSAH